MDLLKSPNERLRLLLGAVALHSFMVGLGLIFVPPELMQRFGYGPFQERFFAVQAGVFHFVMVTMYALPGWRPERWEPLVELAIIAKSIAFLFLVIYYTFVDTIWVVLFSGLADGAMGVLIWAALRSWRTSMERSAPDGPRAAPPGAQGG